VFGEGTPRRTEAASQAALYRRKVRGLEPERRTDLIVRIAVGRLLAEPSLGERLRLAQVAVELRIERRGRRRVRHVGARLAEIVFDGDDALFEQRQSGDELHVGGAVLTVSVPEANGTS
jgi:hypothetical protein